MHVVMNSYRNAQKRILGSVVLSLLVISFGFHRIVCSEDGGKEEAGGAEKAAAKFWENHLVPLTKAKEFTKDRGKACRDVLALFKRTYGKTKYAALAAKELKALEERAGEERATAPGPAGNITLDLGEGVNMEFVLIKAGTFMMGPGEKEKHTRLWKQHPVTLTASFYLGTYEVTQAQYEQIMGQNPSSFKGTDRPVETVSWTDCQAFCKKLSEKTGRSIRLPTSAEWEYACRAGTTTRSFWGDDNARRFDYGWFPENSKRMTHPVGQKKANPWGLYDIQGNVWEWVEDRHGPYTADHAVDPKGPASAKGQSRATRGGAYQNDNHISSNMQTGGEGWRPYRLKVKKGGFRVLLEVKNPGTVKKADGELFSEACWKNWPRFRGPDGNGIARVRNAPLQWDGESGKGILWKVKIPEPDAGYSSPIVWGNKVIVTGGSEKVRKVFCFDADKQGKELWSYKVEGIPGSPKKSPEVFNEYMHAASTPATDGERVYAVFATGDLVCLDLEKGTQVWAKNLGVPENMHGHASSLLVWDKKLIVPFENETNPLVLCLDARSGKEVWSAKRSDVSWSSPILVNTVNGR
jgi:formylglycine-generating enzyme required for sulfatase activity